MRFLSRFSLSTLLVAACLVLGMVPMVVVGLTAWNAAQIAINEKAASFSCTAANLAEVIDRNLAERYGDVQAFGLNQALLNEDAWYYRGEESPIVQAMNSYVDTYDCYYLTLLVDLEGRLIAANTRNESGKPIDTSTLYDKNYASASWFRDCVNGRFYEGDNGGFTGTVVEDLYVDQSVKQIYGDEGVALGFSAPVRGENGEVIAVWKNVAKFGLVEDIVLSAYQGLKSRGFGTAEVTLLDKRGNVIVDCDPSALGREEIVRDMSIIGKFNLAEKGVESAQRAVRGETGSLNKSYHARKEIYQVAGYASFKGALGFAGMPWNALVRVSQHEALAAMNQAKMTFLVMATIGAIIVVAVGWVVLGAISNVLRRTVNSMELAAEKDYSEKVETSLSSDLSRMTQSLNAMLDSLAESEKEAEEAYKLRRVVEYSDSTLMLVDRDLEVTYVNRAMGDLLKDQEKEFRRAWPAFDRGKIVGACIEQINTGTKHDWKRLTDPTSLPNRTDILIGDLILEVVINSVLNSKGEHVGSTLIWTDVTETRRQQESDADFRGQLAAISRSQAVIEFTTDGTVIDANENFLSVMGYDKEEIVGKHHRQFVDSEYALSDEYKDFWKRLNRGEFWAGEFQRVGKGGKEIWIQASYNPIFDRDSKLTKIVKYATDITAAKKMEQEIKHAQQLEQEKTEVQQQKVATLLQAVNAVAAGDMSIELPDLGNDAVGQVAKGVGSAVEAIRVAMSQVREVAATVATSARELAEASDQISSGAQTQASSLEETAASLEEITSTVKQNTDNSQQAQQLSSSSREVAESGGRVVGDAVEAMTSINAASKKIAEIITTIDEIAFQTNLLALNAAVEAARAGEQGRGFAVVASEVRNLAQRSAGAAKEIKTLIKDSVQRVENGTELVNKSGETLHEIVTSVKRVADIVTEISAASTEQLSGIEQVNNAVSQMDRVTQTNAAQTEEMAGTSQSLLSHSEQLQQLVAAFKLDNDQAESPEPVGLERVQKAGAVAGSNKPATVTTSGAHELDLIGVGAGADDESGSFVEF